MQSKDCSESRVPCCVRRGRGRGGGGCKCISAERCVSTPIRKYMNAGDVSSPFKIPIPPECAGVCIKHTSLCAPVPLRLIKINPRTGSGQKLPTHTHISTCTEFYPNIYPMDYTRAQAKHIPMLLCFGLSLVVFLIRERQNWNSAPAQFNIYAHFFFIVACVFGGVFCFFLYSSAYPLVKFTLFINFYILFFIFCLLIHGTHTMTPCVARSKGSRR